MPNSKYFFVSEVEKQLEKQIAPIGGKRSEGSPVGPCDDVIGMEQWNTEQGVMLFV